MEINHWFSENFPEPESMLEEKSFYFTVNGNKIEIECSWDYGWGGRGTERIFLPLETLEKFLADHREELSRRSNGHPTK